MIYTITLNPAIDCAIDTGALALGKVNRANGQTLRFGGKGINVSYVLREFGAKSILTGFAAGFTGDALSSGLAAEGFDCDFIHLANGNTRINVKLTSSSPEGDPDTEINAPGPTPSTEDLRLLTDKLSRLTGGDAVVLAGSLPSGVSPAIVHDVANSLHDGVSFICDLSGESLRAALAESPDLVKPNIHELFELLEIPATAENLSDRELIKGSAARLISMGAKNALITMGNKGAYYILEDGDCGFVLPPIVPESSNATRSAVGCGDSAVAGWLIGMGYAGKSVRDYAFEAAGVKNAAELAVAFGSASYYFGFPASPEKVRLLDR
ncbi:MAG: 1-phosphofructokinase family hexose kinase [Clostridia bacterium]|nr:1-phosphofructokinase family hexose kinase [Clostridia bacterium]